MTEITQFISGQPLRMRIFLNAINNIRHAEERFAGARLEARIAPMQPYSGYLPNGPAFVAKAERASARLEILGVFGAWPEVRVARPFLGAPAHVIAVAHAEQQGALGAGDPFVQFAGRMHDKGARLDGHGFGGRAHRAAAPETEINFGRVRVAVIPAGRGRL